MNIQVVAVGGNAPPPWTSKDQALLLCKTALINVHSTEFYSEKSFKLANGGSEWERSTASGFSVPCTTTKTIRQTR